MSVIIKGFEMPESCATCTVQQEANCGVNYKWLLKHPDYYYARRPNCPLVEIPTPHGRIVDYDRIFKDCTDLTSAECNPIRYPPIVILEAEGDK